eukprot:scaffold109316_cov56-Phaeocystis_antarctica.AAC.5
MHLVCTWRHHLPQSACAFFTDAGRPMVASAASAASSLSRDQGDGAGGSSSESEPAGVEPEPCSRALPQSMHLATPPAPERVRLPSPRRASLNAERSVGSLVIVARSG